MISYICSKYVCYTYFIRIVEVPVNLFYDFRKFLIVLKLVFAFFFFACHWFEFEEKFQFKYSKYLFLIVHLFPFFSAR